MNASTMSIEAALRTLGERLVQARLAQNRTQRDLAREAGVSKRTVERLENGESTQLSSFVRVLFALGLDARLDQLVPAAGPRPIELLELQGRQRRRASGKKRERKARDGKPGDWSWDDES